MQSPSGPESGHAPAQYRSVPARALDSLHSEKPSAANPPPQPASSPALHSDTCSKASPEPMEKTQCTPRLTPQAYPAAPSPPTGSASSTTADELAVARPRSSKSVQPPASAPDCTKKSPHTKPSPAALPVQALPSSLQEAHPSSVGASRKYPHTQAPSAAGSHRETLAGTSAIRHRRKAPATY